MNKPETESSRKPSSAVRPFLDQGGNLLWMNKRHRRSHRVKPLEVCVRYKDGDISSPELIAEDDNKSNKP